MMADGTEPLILEQDRLISVPEHLLAISADSSAVMPMAACDSAQTDCTGCLGAPCQGNNCQTGCLGSAQCSQSCSQSCSQGCSQSTVQPQPPTAAGTLTIYKVDVNSVTVRISAISKATGYEIVWRHSTATQIEGTMDVGSTGLHTIEGLEPETAYVINYRGYNNDGVGPFMNTGKTFTTLSLRPDDWSWWTRVQSDGNIDISADEWNAFCDRINEFRDYCGLTAYYFTTVRRGDYISANVVNEAVWAIRNMSPPISPPSQVTPGVSYVTAAFFNGLKNALNSID